MFARVAPESIVLLPPSGTVVGSSLRLNHRRPRPHSAFLGLLRVSLPPPLAVRKPDDKFCLDLCSLPAPDCLKLESMLGSMLRALQLPSLAAAPRIRVLSPLRRPGTALRGVRPESLCCFSTLQESLLGLEGSGPTIIRNPTTARCYEDALRYESGTRISSSGALAVVSGLKTGRSPSDKRIVLEQQHEHNIWWGPVNTGLSELSFLQNRKRAMDFLNSRKRPVYVVEGYAGWDPSARIKVRVVCTRAYHALFMRNMLILPSSEAEEQFGSPDFTIYNAGECSADPDVDGNTSATSVSISFDRSEMIILGTEYAGEMKKGVFTVMHYLMPSRNVLSLHASANEGSDRSAKDTHRSTTSSGEPSDVTLFFGLSGTGKTTLSADSRRRLIGDDEHCWTETGVFNIENGCYAKAIDLSRAKEPEIFDAIRFGTVLENVELDDETREVDYSSRRLTENTRACYPIEHIANSKIPCIGGHPKNIIFLTCDAFGVLPPVAQLTPDQAVYHFLSGYTAKIAGTEDGVSEPQATFSACFGQPFLVWHPVIYANMLRDKIREHKSAVWMINTGWTGGRYGTGKRIPLQLSRSIVDEIHSGRLSESMSSGIQQTFPVFNLAIPTDLPGMGASFRSILDPRSGWPSGAADFDQNLRELALLFDQNFAQFSGQVGTQVARAGVKL
ncbi:phosphoenolpyruvate carboxykinase [ATP] [Polychytrium aggregatum]|uniref:phosphoenolpyruvate carboxykinase [ATP] n=1 Tax=Polychytrium aggregatum TaxID=110093 RepID=UPI0022FEF8B6|nr:phosphoenolpyruvate carboxykinase [ATP] [Polychytrium aggregatum]KAI9208117.1 phosphoenolpyruvate carboxykinase [ATP] [Polychytrium aggregatum]